MQTTRNQAWSTGRLAAPAAVALGLLLGGCLTPDTTGSARQVSLPEPPPQRAAPPTAAQREHERILASYNGAYQDPKLDAVVNSAVEKLVAASERPDQRYRVTVLNSSAVNAFALPGGQLYVTRGLISLANDTSELASVLSHEMAHVIAQPRRDARGPRPAGGAGGPRVRQFRRRIRTRMRSRWRSPRSRSRPSRARRNWKPTASASASPHAPATIRSARSASCPRSDARPSCARRARAPAAAADGRMPDFLSSHPATPERVRNAQINARQFTGPGGGNRDREAYLAGIDGMLYGEDPSEGYVRGRRFLHPRLGFTFMAPEGFTLDNTPQAVLGIKDGGGQALRLDVVRVPAEQPLPAYLNSGWIENIDGATVEDVTIGGFPAATAVARGDQWAFRLFVVRFGSDVYRFIFATKQMTPAADRSFREAVNSFRRMSTAEAAATKPLRIRMVPVERRRHRRAPRRPHGDRPQGRAVPHPQRPQPLRPPARGRSGEDRDGVKRRSASARPRESGDPD